jgi:alpha-beta hydrolase superfamily lysophospholipase
LSILFSSLFFPTQQYPIPLDDPALFTSSPSWQRFLDSDPDALKKASARFLVQSVRLDLWFRLNCRGWKVPTLLFLGLQEKIVNNKATRERIEDLAQGSIQVIEYPSAHHTLEFEGPEVPWVENLGSWLEKIGHPGEMMPITPAG